MDEARKKPNLTLFWPTCGNENMNGYIVGWNTSGFRCCVASIISDVSLKTLELSLFLLAQDPDLADLWSHCSGAPVILGYIRSEEDKYMDRKEKQGLEEKRDSEVFWIELTRETRHLSYITRVQHDTYTTENRRNGVFCMKKLETVTPEIDSQTRRFPVVTNIFSCGEEYSGSAHFIFYEHPSLTSYYSIKEHPTEETDETTKETGDNRSAPVARRGRIPSDIENTYFWEEKKISSKEVILTKMERTLRQINSASSVETLLEDVTRDTSNLPLVPSISAQSDEEKEIEDFPGDHFVYRKHRGSDVLWGGDYHLSGGSTEYSYSASPQGKASEESQPAASPASFYLLQLLRIFFFGLHVGLFVLRVGMDGIVFLLTVRFPVLGGCLREKSALCKQLHNRLQEMMCWPYMWVPTRARWRYRWGFVNNDEFASESFVLFWESIYRCLVDITFGLLVGVYIRANIHNVLTLTHHIWSVFHMEVMRSKIWWLMGIPAGLKVNENLGHTLGSMALYTVDLWNVLMKLVTPAESYLWYTVSFTGIFGFSCILAACSDILMFYTFHVEFIHSAFTRMFALELVSLSALWKLFRGKKKNVLRGRIDSCSYDMEQLLVGTLLFTTLVLLAPTICIYYLFISLVRLVVAMLQALLFLLMTLINHFPLFRMFLHVFEPGRLPAGIFFQPLYEISEKEARVLKLEDKRLTEHKSGKWKVETLSYLHLKVCVWRVRSNRQGRVESLSALFFELNIELKSLLKHFSFLRYLKAFVSGEKYSLMPRADRENEDSYVPSKYDFWMFLKCYVTP